MSQKESNNLKKLTESISNKKRNCVTNSSCSSIKNEEEISTFKNKFGTFKDYINQIKNNYYENFKINENNITKNENKSKIYNKKKSVPNQKPKIIEYVNDIFVKERNLEKEKKKQFNEKMPYISGRKTIDDKSIIIPENQYFLNIFKKIIDLINYGSFPNINKFGIAYFFKNEWIYFTTEEIYFQEYISDSKKIMSILYKDFMDKKVEPDNLFTENDTYIFPSSVRGLNYEKNAFDYFQLKTRLEPVPDILIKLVNNKNKDNKNYFDNTKEFTFDEYFQNIIFNYMEIDGALINKKKAIIINKEEKAIISYKQIIVSQVKKKDTDTYTYKCEIEKTENENIDNINFKGTTDIVIPKKTVVFFQTKANSPNIQLNRFNSKNFELTKLNKKEMKNELAVVINKMIITGEYFYELYKKLGLIKDINYNYNVLFFLIFNNFPINDITSVIKNYIDILIEKG